MILWQSDQASPVVARVAIAGDFLPAWKFAAERPSLETSSDWERMAQSLASHFGATALSFVNCECPINTAGLSPRPLNGLGDIVSAPDMCLEYLAAIRARVVGIANNHSYDFGTGGVHRTRSAIVARGFTALGAGYSLEPAPEVFRWQGPRNIRVGFWAAARATVDPATRTRAGVEPATVQRARMALQQIKQCGAQFAIALLHAGCLRTSYPSPEDLRLIDGIAHAGFDVVAASHSHRISGAKIILRDGKRPAFCFYGLGSIVSGFVPSPMEREGLIVVAGLDGNGTLVCLEVRPVLLDRNGFGTVPADAANDAVLNRFRQLSAHIEAGSCVRHFHAEISPGLVRLYARDARRAFKQAGVRGIARKVRRVRMHHLRRLMHSVLP
ncbi:MAG TPA: CapA family protein [Candidatus Acidoferrales bacterium]|nr:CapA family protein [Candidatus Acidoferrales bacterium]